MIERRLAEIGGLAPSLPISRPTDPAQRAALAALLKKDNANGPV